MELKKYINPSKLKIKKSKPKKVKRSSKSKRLTPIAGYEFTPSIIKTGNRYATILSVVNRFGMNRNNEYGWFINMIPTISEPSVKSYLFHSSKPMEAKEQKNIFNKKVNDTIKALDIENAPKGETEGEIQIRQLHAHDLAAYSTKESIKDEKAIDFQILMLLVSDNPDDIIEQVRKMKKRYNDLLPGIDLTSVAGDQKELFRRLLSAPRKSVYDYSTMSSDFAGFDHSVRKGLDDKKGVSIGELTESLTNGNAMMDLNGTFKKRILISASEDSYIYEYDKNLSASSMWGQKIANHAMAYGHRTFHIVLNDFKYYAEEPEEGKEPKFSCMPSMNTALDRVDLSKGGLNIMEMFGNEDDRIEIYNTKQQIIAHIFYLNTSRTLEKGAILELRQLLNDYYHKQKLWDDKVDKYPQLARALNVGNHESMPTSDLFLTWLNENLHTVRAGGTEREINNSKDLYLTLMNTLDSYPHLFKSVTKLPDTTNYDKFQYYYELTGLNGDSDILEAQFINAFDYITNQAEKDDIIMIHGIDRITTETLDIIKSRINTLIKSGVRMAYLFDRMGTGSPIKKQDGEEIYFADMFNTREILYDNFESQFDYTILGTMNKKDFRKYEEIIDQKLPKELVEIITAPSQHLRYQIRRPSDLTSNYILADFIV
ncbi:hypothetical protein [Mammaliicoccus sciuri]|uniref:hypothetical protein n=1 Tax=Mammaliicoccus sciuri TaxID=1296 RepID=UPI000D1E80BB|nr:hypothetical protein [Mammaliicoccus sciuri]PTJ52513.1 hypothetical protein BU012_04775 [Mammaliicoccus sciuri]